MANGLIRQQNKDIARLRGKTEAQQRRQQLAADRKAALARQRAAQKAATKQARERAALYRAKTREATERKKMVKVLHPTRYKIAHGKPFRKKAIRRSLPKLKHGRRTVSGLMDYHL